MEVGGRIRELRAAAGMSQDDLAARVYVSRQTISSWENGKTYPDVQSLLLLSEIFGASVDSLIKGDVETMNETIDRDIETMKRLSYVMLGFLLLMIAAMIWVCLQAASRTVEASAASGGESRSCISEIIGVPAWV